MLELSGVVSIELGEEAIESIILLETFYENRLLGIFFFSLDLETRQSMNIFDS